MTRAPAPMHGGAAGCPWTTPRCTCCPSPVTSARPTTPSGAAQAIRFLQFLALVPSVVTLAISLFINLVPEAYHEPSLEEQQRQEALLDQVAPGAGGGEAGQRAGRRRPDRQWRTSSCN